MSILFTIIIGAASRAEVLQYDIVQRNLGTFHDHNMEEQKGLFTRPTLDLYIMNRYWNFITKGLSTEEIADLENAKKSLENYEKLYTIFEYGSELAMFMTTLETRIAQNNPSVPMTIYRQVCIYVYKNH